MRKLVLASCWLVGLLVISAFTATRLPIRQNGSLIFIAALLPWLLLASAVMCAVALLLRSRRSAFLLVCTTCLLAGYYAPLFLPRMTPRLANKATLRVMSYSVWATNRMVDVESIADMILAQRADVVALQEVNHLTMDRLEQALALSDPSTHWHSIADFDIGQAVLSRYPLVSVGSESKITRLLKVQVMTQAGPIALWNIHAFRPDFSQGGLSFLAYGGGKAPQPQTQGQIDWLVSEVRKESQPLVLLGDFNVSYGSSDHDFMSASMRDAHWEAGAGFGFTFPASDGHARQLSLLGRTVRIASPIRLAKIDHIFVSVQFGVFKAQTLSDSVGSDHAPVFAELAYSR